MKKTPGDHLLSVVKAGLAAVPTVGGPISVLIGEYVPSSTQRHIESAVNMLEHKVVILESRIDVLAVDKDEFSDVFKSAYLEIVRTHQKEKHDVATSLVMNLLLKEGDKAKLEFQEVDHFARSLEVLSVGAIAALARAVDLVRETRKDPLRANVRFSFGELSQRLPDIDVDLLMGLVGELNAVNLLHSLAPPRARMANYANYPMEVTRLGARFVEYVLRLVV
jgi:hypothetical protein